MLLCLVSSCYVTATWVGMTYVQLPLLVWHVADFGCSHGMSGHHGMRSVQEPFGCAFAEAIEERKGHRR